VTAGAEGADPIGGLVRSLLTEVGEDPSREGLVATPSRVAKSYRYLLSGYAKDLETVVNGAIFEEPYSEMVVVRDI
jgi:GTP cyclohydrolase I